MKTFLYTALIASTAVALPRPGNSDVQLPALRVRPNRRQNQVIPVVVGGQQDVFVPNSVVAAVGDVLQFQFSNGNHTVTQSTANEACRPMANGVHSGHIPFQDGQQEVGTFSMVVQNTEPMFLYCATGPHCQLGQVMVVNPVNAKQVADYAKKSQETKESVDGTAVVGGWESKIALASAAFVPAPPEDAAAAPPPAAAPPAGNATNATAPAAPAAPAAEKPPAANVPAVLVGLGIGV